MYRNTSTPRPASPPFGYALVAVMPPAVFALALPLSVSWPLWLGLIVFALLASAAVAVKGGAL